MHEIVKRKVFYFSHKRRVLELCKKFAPLKNFPLYSISSISIIYTNQKDVVGVPMCEGAPKTVLLRDELPGELGRFCQVLKNGHVLNGCHVIDR